MESRRKLTPIQAELLTFFLVLLVIGGLILLSRVDTKRINRPNPDYNYDNSK